MDSQENKFSIEFFENDKQSKLAYYNIRIVFHLSYKIAILIIFGIILYHFVKVSNFILSNELSSGKSILLGIVLIGFLLFLIVLAIIFGILKYFTVTVKKENSALEMKMGS